MSGEYNRIDVTGTGYSSEDAAEILASLNGEWDADVVNRGHQKRENGSEAIERVVSLRSNPGETVLTPFMGVGSEVYSAVSLGRRGIGAELKASYYRQAIANLQNVDAGFVPEQFSLGLDIANMDDPLTL